MQANQSSSSSPSGFAACASVVAVSSVVLGAEAQKFVYYIDKSAPIVGQDGSSWEHAFRDIQDAIDAARSKLVYGRHEWEYRIAQGEYRPGRGSLDRNATFNFTPPSGSAISVSLRGSFGGLNSSEPDKQDFVSTRTILSGDLKGDDLPAFTSREDNAFEVARLFAQAKWARIEGITVRGGNSIGGPEASGWGGASGLVVAVWRDEIGPSEWTDGQLEIQNCRIEENLADRAYGGGMYAGANFMFVSDSQFLNNRANRGIGGGAWMSMNGGTWPTFFGCLFESNVAAYGGGLFVNTGASVIATTFADNSALVQGGAILGGASLDGSLLIRNNAGSSGGAIAYSGVDGMHSRFSTIVENSAPVAPAISVYSGWLEITNGIIWGNTGGTPNTAPVRVVDSIRGCSVSNSVLSFGQAGVEIVNSEATFMGTISDSDPLFIRPAAAATPSSGWRDWNYRLRFGSPAIGIGGDDFGWDLDGNNWWVGDSLPPDAGCYMVSGRDCPADLAPDWPRMVNDADFVEFIAAYEIVVSPPANPNADLNRDGLVNDEDFAIFAVAYDALLCP